MWQPGTVVKMRTFFHDLLRGHYTGGLLLKTTLPELLPYRLLEHRLIEAQIGDNCPAFPLSAISVSTPCRLVDKKPCRC